MPIMCHHSFWMTRNNCLQFKNKRKTENKILLKIFQNRVKYFGYTPIYNTNKTKQIAKTNSFVLETAEHLSKAYDFKRNLHNK